MLKNAECQETTGKNVNFNTRIELISKYKQRTRVTIRSYPNIKIYVCGDDFKNIDIDFNIVIIIKYAFICRGTAHRAH